MEDKWSKYQSNQITALYGQLKGEYEREAYQKIYAGQQLDYIDAFSTLNSLIEKQNKKGGLEGKVLEKSRGSVPATSTASKKTQYILGGLATAIGFAIAPPLGAAALLTTTLMMYNSYQNEYKTA